MLTEICRLVVSVLLIVVAGFLYWCGFDAADEAVKIGATNIASVILTATVTYWLRPTTETKRRR